jgi:glycosyltransferase involved in cell wall biosynthesis
VHHPKDAQVVWLLADWCWERLWRSGALKDKKVITTVHHIVPEKFGHQQRQEFDARDKITTAYHVYNERTLDFIRPMTDKPVHFIKYWANQKIWNITESKSELRKKYDIPEDGVKVIGSFQRDTEGHDLKSPKLEKGPDLFADYVGKLAEKPFVLLAGWRRQYVISRLETMGIPYKYFERPDQSTVNELYQCLDLYVVSARHEGGPQSLIECGLTNVPVISTPVGIAEQVLPSSAINVDLAKVEPAIPDVDSWKLPDGYLLYRKLINSL